MTIQDRLLLLTETPLPETERVLYPSVFWTSGLAAEHVQRAAAGDDGLAIGQMLSGRYRIERELGEGGQGVVYLVSDQQVVGETFAVKVLKEALDPQALQLLREEVRQTRKLSHPNIVNMHSVNKDGKKLYVLMEHLEGKTLSTLLDEEFGRGMPFSHVWPMIEDVGAALGYAHDHNVVHSDLKPANVLLTTSRRAKLLDFGIARVSRGPLLHKRSGQRALTPTYASYEMLKGKEADPRDDIYSFACVIYEMLSGERPFGELNALEARDLGTRVPPLAVLSPAQNEALAQALAFDRASRTASVERLLAGLAPDKVSRGRQNLVLGVAIATAAAVSLTYLAANKLWNSGRSVVVQPVAAQVQPAASRATAVAAFNPPPHSIAVLPFVNMTGDTEQEYFSDGLTEEVLSSLAAIEGLQVAAGTSSFSFKENPDIVAVAHKLNVASVLEGSVRRSEHTVRVSVLLVNAVTGFQLWSKTYDRDLGDALKLQSDIAAAVAQALKVTLLGNVAAKAERGGTPNPAAFAAYPGGRKAHVRGDAHQALAIVPERAEGYLAPAPSVDGSLDFAQASEAHEQARALAPGNAEALRVNAGVIPGLPVEIKVDHLSGNAGFFSPADADSGAGSGDTSGEASGEGDSDDRSGAGAAAGNRAAVFARPESQALRAARAAADESGSLHLIRALAGRSGTAEVDSGNGVAAGNPRTGLSRRHQPAEGVPGATEAPRA